MAGWRLEACDLWPVAASFLSCCLDWVGVQPETNGFDVRRGSCACASTTLRMIMLRGAVRGELMSAWARTLPPSQASRTSRARVGCHKSSSSLNMSQAGAALRARAMSRSNATRACCRCWYWESRRRCRRHTKRPVMTMGAGGHWHRYGGKLTCIRWV